MNATIDTVARPYREYVNDGVQTFLVYDFDGVFNVMYRSGTFKKNYYNPTDRFHYPNPHYVLLKREGLRTAKKYEIVWSSELVDDVNTLAADDSVQVVWLTTWRKYSLDVAKDMGFSFNRPPVYLPWGPTEVSSDHSKKLTAFTKYFADFSKDDGVKTAWLDDVVLRDSELVYEKVAVDSAMTSDNLLLIAPDERYGLSRDEMAVMRDFLNV